MKAITTKFHGATDARGSRVIASDQDGNKVIASYDHALNAEQMHAHAADMLCRKMQWAGTLIQGSLAKGYVFVWLESFGANAVKVGGAQ